MECPLCGNNVPDDAAYCGSCGTAVRTRCTHCRAPNPRHNRYCQSCGTPMLAGAQTYSWEPPTRNPHPSAIVCPRCHVANDPGSRYCYSCGLPLEGEPEEAIDAADVDRQGRGFWIRLAAALIDGLLLMIVLGIAISLLWDAEDIARSVMLGEDGEHWTMIETFGTLLPLAYFTGPVALWGATVGKAVLGMRIVRADGGRVGWGRALARCLAWLLSWLLLAAGHIMIASRRDKRGLHDLIAGTRVIRSRGRG